MPDKGLVVDPLFTAGFVCTSLAIWLVIFIGPFAAVIMAVGVVLTAIGRRRAMRSFDDRYPH